MSQEDKGGESFYVTISASGRDPRDPTGIIHAISVSQPVQSWTVVREYSDFAAVGKKLIQINPGLPPCPEVSCVPLDASGDQIIQVRNILQEWLISVLLFPGARESPALRQFMTFGANQVPAHFEGAAWLHFSNGPKSSNAGAAAGTAPGSPSGLARHTSLDEMEMDFMFDTGGSCEEEDDEGSDDDELIPYAQRYPPPDEVVTQEDVDLMESLGEVEMIEDVGSLAQSLGASHLGRSLQLQAQIERMRWQGINAVESGARGITVGGAASNVARGGGIARAMENSGGIPGLGDSFFQQKPISAPRLDSFMMIKVIGKGSFGKWIPSASPPSDEDNMGRTYVLSDSFHDFSNASINQEKFSWFAKEKQDKCLHSKFCAKTALSNAIK